MEVKAGCGETRRSTSGYVFTSAGAAVSWRSNKQAVVSLSSTEAEYIAGTLATQEAMFLRYLMRDLGLLTEVPTTICIDNRSAIALGKNYISNKLKFPARARIRSHILWAHNLLRFRLRKMPIKSGPLQYCNLSS